MSSRAPALLLAAGLCCGVLAPHAALASLARAELDRVWVSPPAGAALPHGLTFHDPAGNNVALDDLLGRRPAVLVLSDYRCRELCGPILSIVAHGLAASGLTAGRDYDLIVIGLDPQATPADAAAMKAAQIDGSPGLAGTAHVLTGPSAGVAAIERSLGYRAAHDADSHRFAHPAVIFVLTADGALSGMLPGLTLDPRSLRLALVEAGEGRIGSIADRIHLFCYGLDPAKGVATRAVQGILFGGGLLTIGGLVLFIGWARPRRPEMRDGRSA